MSEYIIKKSGGGYIAIFPDGEESEVFEDHEECLECIAEASVESGEESSLLYDDGSGSPETIPNWDPQRFLRAAADPEDDEPDRRSRPRRERGRVRRNSRNVRKSRGESAPRRRRRGGHRGGSFDFGSYMSTARQVRDNLSELFVFGEENEA